jgi:hypothetical protein
LRKPDGWFSGCGDIPFPQALSCLNPLESMVIPDQRVSDGA